MTLKTLAAASCLSVAMATSTIAAPITLDFGFSFVTGTFYGLDDADGTGSATSFDLSYLGSSFTDVSASSFTSNSFTFSSGVLTELQFSIDDSPVSDDFSLQLRDLTMTLTSAFANFYFTSSDREAFPAGSLTLEISPVSAVPLPAGGLLLLSGLGGVAALKRRKKRAA